MRVATPQPANHPTADGLIEAGLRLAEHTGLSQMSVDAVVAAAGVAKGTFYVHFEGRTAYLIALHRRFHDGVRVRIASATRGLSPGPERLRSAATAYLDGCLASRGVKAILLGARGEPAIVNEVRRSDARFAKDAEVSFAVMGLADAAAAARLFIAMAAETAIAELDSGRKRPDARRMLWHFARIAPSGAGGA